MDQPQVHTYLWKYVLSPLVQQGLISLKQIKWDKKIPAADADLDDEEALFDSSNYSLRLLGLILADHLAQEDADTKSAQRLFESLGGPAHQQAWLAKIEEAPALWQAIEQETGPSHSLIILNILQDG